MPESRARGAKRRSMPLAVAERLSDGEPKGDDEVFCRWREVFVANSFTVTAGEVRIVVWSMARLLQARGDPRLRGL